MSEQKTWGLFAVDGAPVATGNDWYKWNCPHKQWTTPSMEHPITGESIDLDPVEIPCPFKFMGGKMDRCTKCGIEFHYP